MSPNRAGLLVSSTTVGDASDITIPSWTLNNADLCLVDTRGREKRRRTRGEGGDGAIPYVIIPSTHNFFT